MERSKAVTALRWLALGSALLLTGLRVLILKTAFDENGLLPQGSPVLPLTVLVCALCFGGLCLLCRRSCFSQRPFWLFPRLAAGVLVFLGAMLSLLDGRAEPDKAELAVNCAGLVSGLLLVWIGLLPRRDAAVFWLRLLPALYAAASLIMRFRVWSHDPLVIHILPMLLAWTCCMVEMMLLTGFSLGAGHRRSAVLFGVAAGIFACMALPDYLLGLRSDLPDLLTLLGLSAWGAGAASELLRDRVQTETARVEQQSEEKPESDGQAE